MEGTTWAPRVHVVAGATGRIGAALVERLLAHGKDDVVGVARRTVGLERLASRHRKRFRPCATDLADDVATDDLRAAVGDRRVGLVVNAARSSTPGGIDQVRAGDLARAVDLKAGGLLRLVRGADAGLGDGSRIVAVGGRLGYDADPGAAAAGLANAAVALLVRQLAHHLGPRGVSCHVVAPGAVAGSEGLPVAGVDPRGGADRHLPAVSPATSPLGRLPTVEDVVWLITTLTEPSAVFLNGGSLILDGGRRTAVP